MMGKNKSQQNDELKNKKQLGLIAQIIFENTIFMQRKATSILIYLWDSDLRDF